jgi:hypothetical protein
MISARCVGFSDALLQARWSLGPSACLSKGDFHCAMFDLSPTIGVDHEGKAMKLWNFASASLLAGALSLAGGVAHAAPDVVVEGATNGSAAPGGTALTSFTIRFTGIYQFTGAAATITFDPALLTFNPFQSKVSVLGVERSLPAFLTLLSQMENLPGSDFDVYGGENPAGTLFFGAGFTRQGSMPLNGNIIVTTAFDLASTMAVGSVSEVALTQLVMADLDTGIVSLAAPGSPLLMTVTAVPEPESWLMLLAGMGLLGAVTKRRAARA